MSRGPGKWQIGILKTLEQHPTVYLCDLLPKSRTHSEYSALHRAAYRLGEQGKIAVYPGGLRRGEIILSRLGYKISDRSAVPRLKVEPAPK